jgi:DNA polymerase-3 subunit epsilon
LKPFDRKSASKLSAEGLEPSQLTPFLTETLELELELGRAQGIEIENRNGRYYFSTCFADINEATFCIVDIESNGSKPDKHQIIEIGAVKVCNRAIVDTFESLVNCNHISKHITEITGITEEDTADAPSLERVMHDFREFLGTDIFVAHDVKFDYSFISSMMERIGLEPLMNRALCTIDLAERTISSYRYGLSYLNEQLELYKEATHHRALSDAITTAKLFKRTLNYLPHEIKTVEQLIRFSKEAKRLKRPKFDPSINNKEEKKESNNEE